MIEGIFFCNYLLDLVSECCLLIFSFYIFSPFLFSTEPVTGRPGMLFLFLSLFTTKQKLCFLALGSVSKPWVSECNSGSAKHEALYWFFCLWCKSSYALQHEGFNFEVYWINPVADCFCGSFQNFKLLLFIEKGGAHIIIFWVPLLFGPATQWRLGRKVKLCALWSFCACGRLLWLVCFLQRVSTLKVTEFCRFWSFLLSHWKTRTQTIFVFVFLLL